MNVGAIFANYAFERLQAAVWVKGIVYMLLHYRMRFVRLSLEFAYI